MENDKEMQDASQLRKPESDFMSKSTRVERGPVAAEKYDHRRYRRLTAGERAMEVWEGGARTEGEVRRMYAALWDRLNQINGTENFADTYHAGPYGDAMRQLETSCMIAVKAIRNAVFH